MNNRFEEEVEDIQAAVSARRVVRPHGPYGILIGNTQLQFTPAVLADPVPTGTQILAAAGIVQLSEYLLFQVLSSGLLEEIRPDETTDLRSAGAEKFLVFRSDRSFRFQLDDRFFDWGATHISGATLKHLAGVDIDSNDIWLDVRGGADRLISDVELADLTAAGVERFFTRPITITIHVNVRPKKIQQRSISYWEVVRLAFPEAEPSENIIYTIDYAAGPSVNPEGSMVDGQYVQVKDGMKFYVTPTDKS